MLNLDVSMRIHPKLRGILADVGQHWRKELLSVGANALRIEVSGHVRRTASQHHLTATRLGATPTGHLVKGAARITSTATADSATVHIPIAGISRALHDLDIVPVRASMLTIPVAAESYGHRVRELKRHGWKIFRPKGHEVLMGVRRKGDKAKNLYALKQRVTVRQDRSLLPTTERMAAVVNQAMAAAVRDVLQGGNG